MSAPSMTAEPATDRICHGPARWMCAAVGFHLCGDDVLPQFQAAPGAVESAGDAQRAQAKGTARHYAGESGASQAGGQRLASATPDVGALPSALPGEAASTLAGDGRDRGRGRHPAARPQHGDGVRDGEPAGAGTVCPVSKEGAASTQRPARSMSAQPGGQLTDEGVRAPVSRFESGPSPIQSTAYRPSDDVWSRRRAGRGITRQEARMTP